MKKYTVLVSGASGIVGYGILKTLRNLECNLIGLTIYNTSPANCFADSVEIAPLSTDEQYIPWLISILVKYRVDMAIPGIESDMSIWNKNREILSETGAFILLNNSNLINLCLDKWEFYKKMKMSGSPYVIESSIKPDFNQFPTPFILKPRCGYGSKGLVKVRSEHDFEKYKFRIGQSLLMQQYVGRDDEEYTISAFFDRHSNMKSYISLKRKLSKMGYTEIAEVVCLENMAGIIAELAEIFKPVGPTNFQFRRHDGGWKLLEINPRISSSTSIKAAFNYNESLMSMEYFLEEKIISQPEIRTGKVIRYIEDYII